MSPAQLREKFPPRDWELFVYLESAEPQDIITNRRKDQERGSGLAKTFLEKLIRLHIASIQVLSPWGRTRCGGAAQMSLSPWCLQTGGRRRAALRGSDQAASLRDRFLRPRLGQGPQRRGCRRGRAFAECSRGDLCHVAKPAKESSTRGAMALSSLVVHNQIQADSKDNKSQSHFCYALMKLMLKNELQLNSQIP